MMKNYGQYNRKAEGSAVQAGSSICKFFILDWVDLGQASPSVVGLLQPTARLEGTCLLISEENKIFLKQGEFLLNRIVLTTEYSLRKTNKPMNESTLI